jgi:hypothetical protein
MEGLGAGAGGELAQKGTKGTAKRADYFVVAHKAGVFFNKNININSTQLGSHQAAKLSPCARQSAV